MSPNRVALLIVHVGGGSGLPRNAGRRGAAGMLRKYVKGADG